MSNFVGKDILPNILFCFTVGEKKEINGVNNEVNDFWLNYSIKDTLYVKQFTVHNFCYF